jgi:hypothetical protein
VRIGITAGKLSQGVLIATDRKGEPGMKPRGQRGFGYVGPGGVVLLAVVLVPALEALGNAAQRPHRRPR